MASRFEQVICSENFVDYSDCPDFPEIDREFLVEHLTDSLRNYKENDLWGDIREKGKTVLEMIKNESGEIFIE